MITLIDKWNIDSEIGIDIVEGDEMDESLRSVILKYIDEAKPAKKSDKPTTPEAKKGLPKLAPDKIAWWNAMNKDAQLKWVHDNPKGDVSLLVNAGKLHPGQTLGPNGKPQGQPKIPFEELSDEEKNKHREIAMKSLEDSGKSDVESPTEPHDIVDKKKESKEAKELRKKQRAKEKMDEIEEVFDDNPNLGETVDVDDEDAEYVFDPASIYKIKDTTLDPDIKTKETDAFKKSNLQSSEEWSKANKKNEKKTKIELPQKFRYNSKIPPKYIDVLERMLNSKKNNATSSITHFIPGSAGAGTINSQSGEIVMFVASTMREDEWKEMKKLMEDHIDNTSGEGKPLITKEWIKAADDNRQALYKRLHGEYPDMIFPDDIEAGCWDVKEEVEAMGLKDYKNNKGFSTDVYFKVKVGKNKEPMLVQQSLKMSYKVNFINGGTGRLEIWNPDLPKELKLSNFALRQKESLTSFGKSHRKEIEKLFKEKQQFPDAEYKKLSEYIGEPPDIDKLLSGSNRDNRHAMSLVLQMMNTKESIAKYEEIDKMGKDYCDNCISAIMNDPKMTEGLMFDVRSEFPLKSVFTGEEGMSIADSSLDKAVLRKIFGVNSWEEAKERLILGKDSKGKPCLLYVVDSKKPIKVAEIKVREDGVTYGGSVKFEMSLHNEFSKRLKEVNQELYGDERIEANSLKKITDAVLFGLKGLLLKEKKLMEKYLF